MVQQSKLSAFRLPQWRRAARPERQDRVPHCAYTLVAIPWWRGAGSVGMASDLSMARSRAASLRDHVEETRLGIWFLGTDVWAVHVVRRALRDLLRLMPDRRTHHFPVVFDAGCGWGRALCFLE